MWQNIIYSAIYVTTHIYGIYGKHGKCMKMKHFIYTNLYMTNIWAYTVQ